ncbi:MAG: small multi-drug export protein [Bacilli bacterium]|nr:small multi-drug export protein [Bacilli bacterium]
MAEQLAEFMVGLFGGLSSFKFGKELIVFIISLMPILELRGGLIAAALLGLKGLPSFIICFIGNIIPIPFILWFITPIFDRMKKTKKLKKLVDKLEKKAMSKKEQIEKLQYWGLMLFVGIPLPGTGAWTGALIASLLDMNKKKALLFSILGVIMAGIIMMIFSYGLLDNIIH